MKKPRQKQLDKKSEIKDSDFRSGAHYFVHTEQQKKSLRGIF